MGRSPGVRSEARSHRAPCPWPRDPRKKAGEGQRLSGEPPGRCPLQGPEAAGPPLVPAARAPAAGPGLQRPQRARRDRRLGGRASAATGASAPGPEGPRGSVRDRPAGTPKTTRARAHGRARAKCLGLGLTLSPGQRPGRTKYTTPFPLRAPAREGRPAPRSPRPAPSWRPRPRSPAPRALRAPAPPSRRPALPGGGLGRRGARRVHAACGPGRVRRSPPPSSTFSALTHRPPTRPAEDSAGREDGRRGPGRAARGGAGAGRGRPGPGAPRPRRRPRRARPGAAPASPRAAQPRPGGSRVLLPGPHCAPARPLGGEDPREGRHLAAASPAEREAGGRAGGRSWEAARSPRSLSAPGPDRAFAQATEVQRGAPRSASPPGSTWGPVRKAAPAPAPAPGLAGGGAGRAPVGQPVCPALRPHSPAEASRVARGRKCRPGSPRRGPERVTEGPGLPPPHPHTPDPPSAPKRRGFVRKSELPK